MKLSKEKWFIGKQKKKKKKENIDYVWRSYKIVTNKEHLKTIENMKM